MLYVDKKRFEGLNLDLEQQLMRPTDYRYALNARISHEVSDAGAFKSIAGTTELTAFSFFLPTGENKTIGTYENGQNNEVIIFNWNSGGNHGIYIYDDTIQNFKIVIVTSQLDFDKDTYITQIGVIERFLYWSDGVNPIKCVNLDYDYENFDTKNINIELHKPAPRFQPSASIENSDPVKESNQVNSANWQFSYRYLYVDGTYSVFSPKSPLVSFLETIPFKETQNQIDLTINTIDTIPDDVMAIEWAYEKNNSGAKFLFEKVEVDDDFSAPLAFTNTGTSLAVADSDAAKLFETIPFTAQGLNIAKNRLFVGNIKEGLNIEEPDPLDKITLDVEITQVNAGSNPVENSFKSAGTYRLGVVWHDEKTSSGVQALTPLSMPAWAESNFDSTPKANKLTVKTLGTPPSWAQSFSYVISEEGTYSVYQQFRVNVLYYGWETTPEAFSLQSDSQERNFYIGEDTFIRTKPLTEATPQAPIYLYLQMPKAIAWIPDNDTYVRILRDKDGNPIEEIERVITVRGDFIVVGTFGISGPDLQDFFSGDALIEVFKLKSTDTELFYENGGPYPIEELEDQKSLLGDSYVISRGATQLWYYDLLQTVDKNDQDEARSLAFPEDFFDFDAWSLTKNGGHESASPTLVQTETFNPTVIDVQDGKILYTPRKEVTIPYAEDLTRASWSKGRPFIVLENEKEVNRDDTIRFSNTYVQSSNINGLANFEALNEYVLPAERSAIQALVTVKNIALAIHTRETSSLYLNERFIKSSDGSDQLVTSDQVIGQDKVLSGSGNYGTINPESIVEYDGQVFWWDMYNGAVCRYTNAGIFPISNNGMASFFRSVGKNYQGATVVGGYDPKYDEYVLTFSPANTLDGFTICFDVKRERWVSWYSFEPENYSRVGNKFFSFVQGHMYQHDTNPEYNNFYGQQYERELKFVCNSMVEKIKVFTNIHIDQPELATDNNDTYEAVILEGDGRESVVTVADFIAREGLFRSQIYRNRLITEGETDYKQGEQMRGRTMEFTVRTDRNDQSPLKSVNVVFHSSEYSN